MGGRGQNHAEHAANRGGTKAIVTRGNITPLKQEKKGRGKGGGGGIGS